MQVSNGLLAPTRLASGSTAHESFSQRSFYHTWGVIHLLRCSLMLSISTSITFEAGAQPQDNLLSVFHNEAVRLLHHQHIGERCVMGLSQSFLRCAYAIVKVSVPFLRYFAERHQKVCTMVERVRLRRVMAHLPLVNQEPGQDT